MVLVDACRHVLEIDMRTVDLPGEGGEGGARQGAAQVVAAVEKRFPDAKVTGAGREEEEGKVVFEVQLSDKAQHVDVSVGADGTIQEIEKQITEERLPKAVRRVLAEKYGKSQLKLAEEVILVTDGREALDCYEVKMAANGKVTEVKIAADGTVKHEEADEGDEE